MAKDLANAFRMLYLGSKYLFYILALYFCLISLVIHAWPAVVEFCVFVRLPSAMPQLLWCT